MKLGIKAVVLFIMAGIVLLMTGCASAPVAATAAAPSAPSTVTITKTPSPVTVTTTAPPVTVTPPTVTASVTVTSEDDPTSEPAPLSESSEPPVVVDSGVSTDSEGNALAVIVARDSETPGMTLSCDDVLGPIETLGGQPGGCEPFDLDRWNEILHYNANAFSAFNNSRDIGSFRGSAFDTVERAYVGFTACEELWLNNGDVDAAFRTMEPIIKKWFQNRADSDDIQSALTAAEALLCRTS